jgi:hypothetical protein
MKASTGAAVRDELECLSANRLESLSAIVGMLHAGLKTMLNLRLITTATISRVHSAYSNFICNGLSVTTR